MSQEKPILYTYFRSSCSARVRIALAWKGIDYDSKPIHLVKGEQTSSEYLEINPLGEVPSLVFKGEILTQSLAILEFIEEIYPQSPLLPKDPINRAHVRAIAQMIAVDIQPVQNLRVLQKVGDEKKGEWGKHWITNGFKGLEKHLKKVSGKYCFGDEVTFADLCLYPQVYNAERFQVDMSEFPTIQKIYSELSGLEAFQQGDWKNQADCPPDLK
ncbi:Glutathione S-transferase zeta-1 [Entomophthora muscae]|uniref:Glutathione S-transferase zeta-1 n=1 Tax=Entomophthora muscae TaxID=34485 RepID=A0ACC2UI42_9FUNG|nr:Glutathione S-transferase zeta-1 [Entomophthora muscae]